MAAEPGQLLAAPSATCVTYLLSGVAADVVWDRLKPVRTLLGWERRRGAAYDWGGYLAASRHEAQVLACWLHALIHFGEAQVVRWQSSRLDYFRKLMHRNPRILRPFHQPYDLKLAFEPGPTVKLGPCAGYSSMIPLSAAGYEAYFLGTGNRRERISQFQLEARHLDPGAAGRRGGTVRLYVQAVARLYELLKDKAYRGFVRRIGGPAEPGHHFWPHVVGHAASFLCEAYAAEDSRIALYGEAYNERFFRRLRKRLGLRVNARVKSRESYDLYEMTVEPGSRLDALLARAVRERSRGLEAALPVGLANAPEIPQGEAAAASGGPDKQMRALPGQSTRLTGRAGSRLLDKPRKRVPLIRLTSGRETIHREKVGAERETKQRNGVSSAPGAEARLPALTPAEVRLQRLLAKILPDRDPRHLEELSAILQAARDERPVQASQFCRDVNLLLDVLGAVILVSVNGDERPAHLAAKPATDSGLIQFRARESGDTFGGFLGKGQLTPNGAGRPPEPKQFSIIELQK